MRVPGVAIFRLVFFSSSFIFDRPRGPAIRAYLNRASRVYIIQRLLRDYHCGCLSHHIYYRVVRIHAHCINRLVSSAIRNRFRIVDVSRPRRRGGRNMTARVPREGPGSCSGILVIIRNNTLFRYSLFHVLCPTDTATAIAVLTQSGRRSAT